MLGKGKLLGFCDCRFNPNADQEEFVDRIVLLRAHPVQIKPHKAARPKPESIGYWQAPCTLYLYNMCMYACLCVIYIIQVHVYTYIHIYIYLFIYNICTYIYMYSIYIYIYTCACLSLALVDEALLGRKRGGNKTGSNARTPLARIVRNLLETVRV